MRIGLILLALPLVSCAAIPNYDDPKRVARIAELRDARDLCLIQNVPQFDDGASTPAKIGNYVAMSCAVQTSKLVELAIPDPSPQARNAFQHEAARLATGCVLTARRIETDAVDRRRQQPPSQPLP
jgi:hypothetical protein